MISIITYGQKKLIENKNEHAKLELYNIVYSVENFFTISKEYTNIISSSKIITSYFVNKALGKPLTSNVLKIEEEIEKFIYNRKINEKKIFEDILILDDKKPLTKSSIPADILIKSNKNLKVLCSQIDQKLNFYVVESINLDGKIVGNIIFKLNSDAIFNYTMLNDKRIEKFYFMFENKLYNVNSLKLLTNNYLEDSLFEVIPNSDITVYMNNHDEFFFTKSWFLFLLIFISIILFLGIYFLYRLNEKNMLLKVNIETTERVNKKLETKIKEKTKALENLNHELYDKIKEEILKNHEKQSIIHNQSKMAIMGQMLDNIAHQWRQPLSAISSNASSIIVQKELNVLEDKTLKESLYNVIDSTKFLSDTIEDFRGFLRQNKKKENFKIKDIYLKTRKLLISVTKKSDVKIIEEFEDVEMYGYFNELVQVFINLINNSFEAFLETEDILEKYIFIKVYERDEKIYIEIKDNAKGIPPDIMNSVFEAHFTTKEKNSGTGIGLYMTKEIITNNLKGEIFVSNETFEYENARYGGAKFTIVLPKI